MVTAEPAIFDQVTLVKETLNLSYSFFFFNWLN